MSAEYSEYIQKVELYLSSGYECIQSDDNVELSIVETPLIYQVIELHKNTGLRIVYKFLQSVILYTRVIYMLK